MITNCEVIGNLAIVAGGNGWAGGGGVILSWGGEIYNSQIVSNVLKSEGNAAHGGGIYVYDSSCNSKIWNSVISANTQTFITASANGTGGISLNYGGSVRNCVISKNGTGPGTFAYANGIYMRANGTIENCTIMDNNGAGLAGFGYSTYAPRWPGILLNCIVQSNYSYGAVTNWYIDSNTTNLNITNSCMDLTNFPANVHSSGCITSSPQVVNFAGGNYRLSANSPCVNAGTNQTSWMTTGVDLDGRTRIRYGRVDMGAYECIYEGTIFRFH